MTFVALLHKYAHHVEDGVLAAHAHDTFFGFERRAQLAFCATAQIASRSGMMPPVGVYFDLFSSMALIVRFFGCVGRGEFPARPGRKSPRYRPRATSSCPAFGDHAAVGEICMELCRRDRTRARGGQEGEGARVKR